MIFLKNVLIVFCFFLTSTMCYAQQLAFPGAEGFGRFATGGRTGEVYHVTNLYDSGTGSFRDAVSKSNRIVVFDVAGVIRISSRIVVKSNIYIAGQTAPGEGITIYGNGLSFSGANNTICRYLRLRMGAVGDSGKDALAIADGQNMIFDHVSVTWGRDETFSISGGDATNITIQNSIIGQGLMGHSAGGLVQTDKVSIYRTLYIHNDTRNPKFKGTHQYVNNIVYNWKTAAYIMGGDSEGTSYANAEGNLFITGPTGKTNAFSGANERYHIYAVDNMIDDNMDGKFTPRNIAQSEYGGGPTFETLPYDYPSLPTVKSAELFDELVPSVGASLPYRDNLDWLLISDLKSLGTEGEIISNEASLAIGAPDKWDVWKGSNANRTDTDGDGMPDWWENANGTDVSKDDAMTLKDGYANIEHYINSITAEQSQYFLKSPLALRDKVRTSTEITLGWYDFTDFEEGYSIEQLIDGNYKEIARTTKDISEHVVKYLTPQTEYKFRVRAFNDSEYSGYSNVLTVTTKSVPVNVIDPNTYVPDLTWIGEMSNVWGEGSEADNWDADLWSDGKNVLFDETGNAGKVVIESGIVTGDIFVAGDKDYHLSGVIAGKGSLNKTGKGTLTLDNNNTYSGGTVVWGGTLVIGKLANGGQASSIGTSQNWVWNGGKVKYTGSSVSTNREVALENETEFEVASSSAVVTQAGIISGEGTLVKTGAGTLKSAYNIHKYTGNTIVRGGTYELNGKDLLGSEKLIHGKLILEGGTFKTTGGDNNSEGYISFPVEVNGETTSHFHINNRTNIKSKFSGSGNLQLDIQYLREFYQGDWSEFYGTVTANQKGSEGNQFHLSNGSGIPNGRVVLKGNLEMRGQNGKTMSLGALSGASSTTLACCHIKTDGGTITWRVGGLGTDETFDGKITNGIEHKSRRGTTTIVKEGTGVWRLNGANLYRGKTTIEEGTLIINGSHEKDKDHTGTYYTPGQYTVKSGAVLGGKGSTQAPVVIEDGATLSPGDMGTGILTLKNTCNLKSGSRLLIDINRKNFSKDQLKCSSTLTIAGDLELNLIDGQYAAGNSLQILSASKYSGQFANIIPAKPADGLIWDTSALYTSGVLRVKDDPTGIESVNSQDALIKSEGGMITIDGISKNTNIVVYGINGTVVANTSAIGHIDIPISMSGMYIVRIEGKAYKVWVNL